MANRFKTNQIGLTSGVRTALGVTVLNNDIFIKAHPSNTATVWIGDSTVTSGNGYPLDAKEVEYLEQVGSLSEIYAITYSASQRICYATVMKE